MYWPHKSTSWLHIPHCRHQVWSLTTLAWESLWLGLGRDWTPSFIFRTLSPICILSVVGYYFVLPLFFGSLYCIVVFLTRWSRVVYTSSVVVAKYSWSVVMLPQKWQPVIVYYADLGGDTAICIVPDSRVSQMVSEPRFPIPGIVSIWIVIEAMGPQRL